MSKLFSSETVFDSDYLNKSFVTIPVFWVAHCAEIYENFNCTAAHAGVYEMLAQQGCVGLFFWISEILKVRNNLACK